MTTYELTKNVIRRNINKGEWTEKQFIETKEKLDAFLLNGRINTEEYGELMELMKIE